MLDRLLKVEEQLARLESLLLVFFVLLMLGLAVYNVFYRNVLVPVQLSALTEDVAEVEAPVADPQPEAEEEIPTADIEAPSVEEAGGFGGGFGGDFEDAPAEEPAADEAGAGFGGDFVDEDLAEPADVEEQPEAPAPEPEAAGGFGGDFAAEEAPAADDEGFAGGFGGGFGSEEAAPAAEPDVEPTAFEPPVDGVPAEEELPFIARVVDALKIEWIDVLLRQLVLVVGFLGAALATRRRKHITIDALSKLLSDRTLYKAQILTNLVSLVICVFLVLAGLDLVAISLEYPKELMSWAMEWQFQLVFPIGFGLLALHFAIRIVESTYWALGLAEPDPATHGGHP